MCDTVAMHGESTTYVTSSPLDPPSRFAHLDPPGGEGGRDADPSNIRTEKSAESAKYKKELQKIVQRTKDNDSAQLKNRGVGPDKSNQPDKYADKSAKKPGPTVAEMKAKLVELERELLAALLEEQARTAPPPEECRTDFATFARHFWPVVEPRYPLLESVAFDGVCAVLQYRAEHGGSQAIACPPGVSKSILCGAMYPAWLLLKSEGKLRILCASYAHELAERDSVRCRNLIESPGYQRLVDGKWALSADANKKDDYSTTAGGRRLVISNAGKATGERGDVMICDDMINATDVDSETERENVRNFLRKVLPSRLDNAATAPTILIGQRLHPEDPVAVALEMGWSYLCLPAIAIDDEDARKTDRPRQVKTETGEVIWEDPRAPGEYLFAGLSEKALAVFKTKLGTAAFETQYGQNPHDPSAAMFKAEWFTRRWVPRGQAHESAVEIPESFDAIVLSLDAAFKEHDEADFNVISVWGAKGPDRYLLEQWRARAGEPATEAQLKAMSARYPFAKVLIESAANGVAIFQRLSQQITSCVEVKPEGGKVARAHSVTPICEGGAVVLPLHAAWVPDWILEVTRFPKFKNDDQVDSMVHALRELATAVHHNAYAW